jgi:outer membrane receptor protein involved in Fe transport
MVTAFTLFLAFAVPVARGPVQAAAAQTSPAITGVVRDASGAVIAGATIVVRAASGEEKRVVSGPDGRFTVSAPPAGALTVIISANGFSDARRTIAAGGARQDLEIQLEAKGLAEAVTVTATRSEQRINDVPASVTVIDKEEIRQSPAIVADDLLRQLPTFSLFRRASSVSAHPTTQGVSLRGIGPSGVSRTLVLLDGVPFNDPFGGWVYWTDVPLESAERFEVVDNASSSLYGNYAMGGVINIITARPTRRTFDFKTQYGNRGTPKLDFRGSDVWGKLGVTVDGAAFNTDGYVNVVPSERRTTDQTPPGVDNNVTAKFHDVNVKLNYDANDKVSVFGRVGYFNENRNNGKASTIDGTEEANDTTWTTTNVGVRMRLPDTSTLEGTVFTDNETFHSNFLAVPAANPPRSVGRVSLNQTVPTDAVGGMVQWSRAFSRNNVLSAGTDWRWIQGESQEIAMDPVKGQTPVTSRFSGGDQRLFGAFVQDIIAPAKNLQVTLSARLDHWHNYNPHNLETTIATGLPTINNKPACSTATNLQPPACLADRTDLVGSPRAAARYHFTDQVSVWGDFGYGFRAPTLNELYRQFTVGAVLTKPNDQLGPERLKGGEIGVDFSPAQNVTARATWFDNRVKDPVSNVTIGNNLVQRQNLGRTKISGLQTDLDYRLGPTWKVSVAYLYNVARVVEFSGTTGLPPGTNLGTNCPGPNANGTASGNGTGQPCYLAQVPKNRASLRLTYANVKYATVALGVQFVGAQFDDDQNARVVPAQALIDAGYTAWTSPITDPNVAGLPKYTLVDLSASRTVYKNVDVFLAAENLFNKAYFVGTVPTLLGPPRLVTGGVRVHLQGK